MARDLGIESKGKTKGKQLGITGPDVGIETGKKGKSNPKGGKTNESMLKEGSTKARYSANKKSV